MSKKTKTNKSKDILKVALLFFVVFVISAFSFSIFKSKDIQGLVFNKEIRYDVVVKTPNGVINTEVADNDAKRERGLSFRKSMQDSEGMLFIFDVSGRQAFWMKDMNFPLDILWLDEEGRVVYMEENVATSTYPGYFVNEPKAKYVFEINAGLANKLGIYLGTKLVISTSTKK